MGRQEYRKLKGYIVLKMNKNIIKKTVEGDKGRWLFFPSNQFLDFCHFVSF